MELEYCKCGDYYVPNLVLDRVKKKTGKYGRLRLQFLKEHKKAEYAILLMDGDLQSHLINVDKTAKERVNLLTKEFAEQENITEELKTHDQLKWVRYDE